MHCQAFRPTGVGLNEVWGLFAPLNFAAIITLLTTEYLISQCVQNPITLAPCSWSGAYFDWAPYPLFIPSLRD